MSKVYFILLSNNHKNYVYADVGEGDNFGELEIFYQTIK